MDKLKLEDELKNKLWKRKAKLSKITLPNDLSEGELAYINADFEDDDSAGTSQIDKAIESRKNAKNADIDKKRIYNSVLDDILNALEEELEEINSQGDTESIDFSKREIIAKYREAVVSVFEYTESKYPNYVKQKRQFPPKWMKENKKVMDSFTKYRFLEKLLTAFHRLDNPLRAERVRQIIEQNEAAIKGQKYDGKEYHTLVKNKTFTEKLAAKVGCSPQMIDKYFKAFVKFGILKSFGKVDRYGGGLYADGYMFEHGGIWHKALFINKKDHRKSLENFSL